LVFSVSVDGLDDGVELRVEGDDAVPARKFLTELIVQRNLDKKL
jgi:hypothetical protein